jgi:hypothetical protein
MTVTTLLGCHSGLKFRCCLYLIRSFALATVSVERGRSRCDAWGQVILLLINDWLALPDLPQIADATPSADNDD